MAFLGSAAPPAATISYVGLTAIATLTATPVLTGVSIGAEAYNRTVFMCVHWYTSVAKTLTSATIGGVPATIQVQSTVASSAPLQSAIISAFLPTGTTATVELTFAAGASYYKACLTTFNVTGLLSSTPSDTISTGAVAVSSYAGVIDVQRQGILILAGTLNAAVNSYNMSGVTEAYKNSIATNYWVVGGTLEATADETNRAVGITRVGGAATAFNGAIVGAAFR